MRNRPSSVSSPPAAASLQDLLFPPLLLAGIKRGETLKSNLATHDECEEEQEVNSKAAFHFEKKDPTRPSFIWITIL
jgi:hypothetical protein